MITLEADVLTLDLEDLKPDEYTLKTRRFYVNLEDHINAHCGMCRARNGMLRLHSPLIHFDPESPDFMDDAAEWNFKHDEERFCVPGNG